MTLVDLNDIPGLERAWHELERVRAQRAADPELRATLQRLAAASLADGRLTDAQADQVRAQLDEVAPAVVLQQWFLELEPPPCEPGHAPWRMPPNVPNYVELLETWHEMDAEERADPSLLRAIVRGLAHFTDDLDSITTDAVSHARLCGIPEDIFVPVLRNAVRDLKERTPKNDD